MPAYADTTISARSELSIRDLREEAKPKDPEERNDNNNDVLTRNANLLASFFMPKNN
jgi:hypothetical protein